VLVRREGCERLFVGALRFSRHEARCLRTAPAPRGEERSSCFASNHSEAFLLRVSNHEDTAPVLKHPGLVPRDAGFACSPAPRDEEGSVLVRRECCERLFVGALRFSRREARCLCATLSPHGEERSSCFASRTMRLKTIAQEGVSATRANRHPRDRSHSPYIHI
jgi:hypothetical protein